MDEVHVLHQFLIFVDQSWFPGVCEEAPVLADEEVVGLLHLLDVLPFLLVHQDLRAGLFEEAQSASVIRVEMALDDVLEVIRSETDLLQPVFNAGFRRDAAEVDEPLPAIEPLLVPVRRQPGIPEYLPVRVVDDEAERRASIPFLGALLLACVQDELRVWKGHELLVQAHVAEMDAGQRDPHRSTPWQHARVPQRLWMVCRAPAAPGTAA